MSKFWKWVTNETPGPEGGGQEPETRTLYLNVTIA